MNSYFRIVFSLLLCISVSGCYLIMNMPSPPDTHQFYNYSILSNDTVMIQFKRSGKFWGKARSVFVLDLGENIKTNAIIGKSKDGTLMLLWLNPLEDKIGFFHKHQKHFVPSVNGLIVTGGMILYGEMLSKIVFPDYESFFNKFINETEHAKLKVRFTNPKTGMQIEAEKLIYQQVTIIAQLKAVDIIDWNRPAGNVNIALVSPPIRQRWGKSEWVAFDDLAGNSFYQYEQYENIPYNVVYYESDNIVLIPGFLYSVNHKTKRSSHQLDVEEIIQ